MTGVWNHSKRNRKVDVAVVKPKGGSLTVHVMSRQFLTHEKNYIKAKYTKSRLKCVNH